MKSLADFLKTTPPMIIEQIVYDISLAINNLSYTHHVQILEDDDHTQIEQLPPGYYVRIIRRKPTGFHLYGIEVSEDKAIHVHENIDPAQFQKHEDVLYKPRLDEFLAQGKIIFHRATSHRGGLELHTALIKKYAETGKVFINPKAKHTVASTQSPAIKHGKKPVTITSSPTEQHPEKHKQSVQDTLPPLSQTQPLKPNRPKVPAYEKIFSSHIEQNLSAEKCFLNQAKALLDDYARKGTGWWALIHPQRHYVQQVKNLVKQMENPEFSTAQLTKALDAIRAQAKEFNERGSFARRSAFLKAHAPVKSDVKEEKTTSEHKNSPE